MTLCFLNGRIGPQYRQIVRKTGTKALIGRDEPGRIVMVGKSRCGTLRIGTDISQPIKFSRTEMDGICPQLKVRMTTRLGWALVLRPGLVSGMHLRWSYVPGHRSHGMHFQLGVTGTSAYFGTIFMGPHNFFSE